MWVPLKDLDNVGLDIFKVWRTEDFQIWFLLTTIGRRLRERPQRRMLGKYRATSDNWKLEREDNEHEGKIGKLLLRRLGFCKDSRRFGMNHDVLEFLKQIVFYLSPRCNPTVVLVTRQMYENRLSYVDTGNCLHHWPYDTVCI